MKTMEIFLLLVLFTHLIITGFLVVLSMMVIVTKELFVLSFVVVMMMMMTVFTGGESGQQQGTKHHNWKGQPAASTAIRLNHNDGRRLSDFSLFKVFGRDCFVDFFRHGDL